MKILLGTSNPRKVEYFARQLAGWDVSFLTLRDLGIETIPDENGKSVLENAMRKAAWYGQFWDYVISADSALYIKELKLEDPRQPGLTIRRTMDGRSMSDEEMLEYYRSLAHSLGGKMTCWYQDGYAVCNHGKVSGFTDDGPLRDAYAFYMVDKVHPVRHVGWPLDSISIRPSTGLYFVENREVHADAVAEVLMKDYQQHLIHFYQESLGLERL
ncbi:MAG: hypothetical protein IKC03_11005 [Oscillospiraceae bacterium]|nr:hypothetical protein [Oscillospiraceae bacterium]